MKMKNRLLHQIIHLQSFFMYIHFNCEKNPSVFPYWANQSKLQFLLSNGVSHEEQQFIPSAYDIIKLTLSKLNITTSNWQLQVERQSFSHSKIMCKTICMHKRVKKSTMKYWIPY